MKQQTAIIAVTACVVAMAGFFTLPHARDRAGRDIAHRTRSGADEESGRQRPSRVANARDSFQRRATEISMMKQTTERDDSIRKLAQEWASEDPTSAEQWASNLPENADRTQALNLVCMTRAKHSPAEAISMAQRNMTGGALVEDIVGRWASKDFAEASEWVTGSTTGDMRNSLLAKLALTRAESAPEEAATLVALSMREGQVQEEAAVSVLHQWLRKDPQAAAGWISTFPDGPLKERARTEIEGMRAYASGQ